MARWGGRRLSPCCCQRPRHLLFGLCFRGRPAVSGATLVSARNPPRAVRWRCGLVGGAGGEGWPGAAPAWPPAAPGCSRPSRSSVCERLGSQAERSACRIATMGAYVSAKARNARVETSAVLEVAPRPVENIAPVLRPCRLDRQGPDDGNPRTRPKPGRRVGPADGRASRVAPSLRRHSRRPSAAFFSERTLCPLGNLCQAFLLAKRIHKLMAARSPC
ncbi:uncharacterized protein V1510DRAFT_411960 [Dipodascopsis tothii]|uniref:uncharacterized protein n=1 Tax=Dipodascopsis tothii TaxID=44089 RepID=UPI0034CF10AC